VDSIIGKSLKSLWFDLDMARMHELPITVRARFLTQKVAALAALARGSTFNLTVGEAIVTVTSFTDLGTLQSCISDVRDELNSPDVLGCEPKILDVGANIGQWTVATKLFWPRATVLALEPNPAIFDLLVHNISGLRDVECLQCAVGSSPGTSVLYRQPLTVMSTLFPDAKDTRDDPVEVPIRTIDEVLDGRAIDLLKIDVEGGELDALRGAESTLRSAAFLLVEISLARGPVNGLAALVEVGRIVPKARLVKFGRPFGAPGQPDCEDVLIALG
jgi:FkbM family methyltransferase